VSLKLVTAIVSKLNSVSLLLVTLPSENVKMLCSSKWSGQARIGLNEGSSPSHIITDASFNDIMEMMVGIWKNFKEWLLTATPPESFQNTYDPEHDPQKHVSDYEHPDMSRAPGGYDY
jgi:hypothetical protein